MSLTHTDLQLLSRQSTRNPQQGGCPTPNFACKKAIGGLLVQITLLSRPEQVPLSRQDIICPTLHFHSTEALAR